MALIPYDEYRLANGLKVILQPDPTASEVVVNVLYRVGSKHEDPKRTGFAHLFEHLMFGGSANIPVFDTPLQRVGGGNNAYTTPDITNYYDWVPAANVETALWLESDRMFQLDFSENSLEVQRKVVVEEYRQRYLNEPYADLWLHLWPLVYKQHGYRWPTIGARIDHIEEARLSDVEAFFNNFYAPANATLVVAGQMDLSRTKDLIHRYFDTIPGRPHTLPDVPTEPEQTTVRRLTLERDVPLDALYMVFRVPGRHQSEAYATADLLSDMLGSGKSSRLYQRLVKERRLCQSISAFQAGLHDDSMLVIAAKASDGASLQDIETAVNEVIGTFHSPVEADELEKVRNQVISGLTFESLSVMSRAAGLALADALGDAALYGRQAALYSTITAEDIAAGARRWLDPSRACILEIRRTPGAPVAALETEASTQLS